MIEGKRITLRPLFPSDVSLWADWFNDPVVTEHMNKGAFPNTQARQVEFLENLSSSSRDVQYGIVIKKSDKLVGTIGIHNIDWIHRRGSISLLVGNRDYWGQNLGAEAVEMLVSHAFLKMNLHRLDAGMWSSNIAARRCFEKNGFLFEGTRSEYYYPRTGYVDKWVFGLLKPDWESRDSSRNLES